MKTVHVVGGGFSGLTLAWQLAERGIQVELYEKSARLGGLLGTQYLEEGLVETAANAFMGSAATDRLFRDLQLTPVAPRKESNRRYIWRDRLRQWPLGIFETLGFLFHVFKSFVLRKKQSAPRPGQTVEKWGEMHLGKPATQYLLSPGLQGIYAGDARVMSASLILAPLFRKKREKYRGMMGAEKGMQQFLDALETKLRQKGVRIHLQTAFQISFAGNDEIVLACPPPVAANYLAHLSPTTADLLKEISMASLMTATVFFKKSQTRYKGFGALFPRGQGFRTLGVLLNPFIFPGRNKFYNATFILGGATDPAVLELSDEALLELIQNEHGRAFGGKLEIQRAVITRWPQALPHYDVALEKILSKISLPDKIYLHGNYLGGIGLTKILDRSVQLAEEIARK